MLNIINVELKQLSSSSANVKHSVTTCGSKCNFNYVYVYIHVYIHIYIERNGTNKKSDTHKVSNPGKNNFVTDMQHLNETFNRKCCTKFFGCDFNYTYHIYFHKHFCHVWHIHILFNIELNDSIQMNFVLILITDQNDITPFINS